ncbi:MAG: site-specific integrase [Planctomycetaceae bacterium]|nr:site-specific integrase [Planctomycetaceae bacterium]
MAVRKHKGKWVARLSVCIALKDKADALLADSILRSCIAAGKRKFAARGKPCCSIRSAISEFLSDSQYGIGRKPCAHKTLLRHRRRLEIFDKLFRSQPLDCIEQETLNGWIKRRLASGVSPDTVSADLVSLFAFCRWAMRKELAPQVLPIMLVQRPQTRGKLPGLNRRPPPVLEMHELKAFIGKIGERRRDVALFLIGMGLFGLRPEAVSGLRRGDVKLPQGGLPGRLHCRGIKGMHDRDIPVPPGSKQERWFRGCLELGKSVDRTDKRHPLVPRIAKTGRLIPGAWTTARLDMTIQRLCERLKIRFAAYHTRHTCISYLQTIERSLGAVQGYAGHAKPTTQAPYSHRHSKDADAAFAAIGEAMGDLLDA